MAKVKGEKKMNKILIAAASSGTGKNNDHTWNYARAKKKEVCGFNHLK